MEDSTAGRTATSGTTSIRASSRRNLTSSRVPSFRTYCLARMTTRFGTLNSPASSAPHRYTALASLPNLCSFVRTSVSGRFSRKSGSNRRKSSRRQRLNYWTMMSRPWPCERTSYLFRSCCATCIPNSRIAIKPKYKNDIVQRWDAVTSK